jgi:TRAP-type C4-dicarboxylate transport system permease small subunit
MIKLLDRVCEVLAVAAATLFLFCTFSICYTIFTRAVGVASPIWVVQFNEYAMLWTTFLGTAYLLLRNRHVSIQIVTSRLGGKGKRLLTRSHNLLGMSLCLVLCYFTSASTLDHIARNVIDVQAVDVPKGYVLLIIPLGFLLLSLQFLRRFVQGLKGDAAAAKKKLSESEGKNSGIVSAAAKATGKGEA